MPTSWRYSSRARSGPRRQRWPGVMSERTLLEAALARLDEAALAVMRSAATNEEQHQILGYLVSAYSLLHALSRLDPAAVDELIQRAIQLGARVSQPKADTAETKALDEGTDRHAPPPEQTDPQRPTGRGFPSTKGNVAAPSPTPRFGDRVASRGSSSPLQPSLGPTPGVAGVWFLGEFWPTADRQHVKDPGTHPAARSSCRGVGASRLGQSSKRTTIRPWMPGSGKESGSIRGACRG